ncbi:hypothetical protein K1T71_013064 [Dendrolimus kikuchii]|uniref:Uncharacterized protein n=1 Tax=Dendrolimus kikuchii TaxID=765133 RepID=A0ACC1CIX0_9NEOP|nr:hypothetical protein K1T71_013064 [Dendrolimus kikuchii]
MPFQYKTKVGSTRKKVTKQELQNAIEAVKSGVSLRKTAIQYGIDRTTLRRYTHNEQKLRKLDDKGSSYKASQIFTIAEEKLLVEYLLNCSKMNYGLSRVQALKLTFEYASSNSKHIPNNWSRNNAAGKDWFRGFLLRNPEISLRTPEATSLSRATSFNKKNVGDFFENLKLVRERYKFEPQNIYNCDETGCTTVQNCPKVLACKKSKQVGQVTSAERGTLVTVCFAVNAIGNVMPPFLIFPRVKFRPDFVVDGPEGSDGDAYPTGWMTAQNFLKFMQHFKKYSRASKENPVLLILDNHESHVSVDVIKFSKDNGITLLTLPPHCSNKLQPYNSVMNNWMLSNPGKTVTIYNIPRFIKTMMSQAFSQANILSGFKSSGIHPFNPNIFGEEDFMCSTVTDRNLSNDELLPAIPSSSRQVQLRFSADIDESSSLQHDLDGIAHNLSGNSESSLSILQTESNVHQISFPTQEENNVVADYVPLVNPEVAVIPELIISDQAKSIEPILSTPQDQEIARYALPFHNQNDAGCSSTIPKISLVTPETIRPYPKAAPRKTTCRGRQPGKTKILTKTPEKDATDGLTPKKNKKRKERLV